MALTTGTLALIGAGVAAAGATGGAIGSAANRRKAREEESDWYRRANDILTSQYYRDPLNTMSSRWLLKAWDQDKRDELEALNNRAVAGGATMENQLAGRKAINKRTDNLYGQLLQNEDQRRDAIDRQRLALDQQHSAFVQNGFVQAAQDWQNWGGQMAQAGMSVMSSGLLGDSGVDAAKYAGDMDKYREAVDALGKVQPITGGSGVTTPGVTGPVGGLAGSVPWK